jgi:CheY-like chemotaxis protein
MTDQAKQILIVEDDLTIRKLLTELLGTLAGYKVSSVNTAEKALDLINRHDFQPDHP